MMLSYYVMYDIVNNFEEKYKEQFNSFDHMFYGANFSKMLDFYNLLSIKENPYNLRTKFEFEKQKKSFTLLIKEIRENNYDQNLIFIAYGIIINSVIYNVTKPYFSSLCGVGSDLYLIKSKQKLERIISYELRELFQVKYDSFDKSPDKFKSNEVELNSLCKIFATVHNLSNTKKIILSAEESLKLYYNQNINYLFAKRWYYSLYDKYSKCRVAVRPSLRTKLYDESIDYLNNENKPWLNPYTNKYEGSSFIELYSNIIEEATKKINKVNEMIFYGDKVTDVYSRKEFIVANSELVNPIFSKETIFKKNSTSN